MYRVRLQDFEGPLDLLLFFIQRDELDIYDIPIAHITDEFLAYVRLMEEIDLDGVADFIYMAALLINIKVRMLLPRPELDEEGEPIDPRQELVERLLEYMRYKEAAQTLTTYQDRRAELYTRGAASSPAEQYSEETPEVLVNTTLFDLISALRRVLTEAPEEPVHTVPRIEYSVEEQRHYVLSVLRDGRRSFTDIVRGRSKGFIIATFLAVLELARQGLLVLSASPTPDDFCVEGRRESEQQVGENGVTH